MQLDGSAMFIPKYSTWRHLTAKKYSARPIDQLYITEDNVYLTFAHCYYQKLLVRHLSGFSITMC